ncbi:MAG: hypothetical protein M3352_10725 [Bacteroidota bacterium]|nr:hypothetical protein [Bacteroidota bacterium]
MHPYLPHLLADIAAAHRNEIPESGRPQTIEEHFEEVERWIEEGDEELPHTFGYYCGLDAINFPPPEQLTHVEMKQVMTAFGHMMFSWNQGIDLPETLPIPIAYKMTVDTLNTKTTIVNSGMMSFDFCTGYAPDCIFKEYCPCLGIWNRNDDEDFSMDGSIDENPF